MSSLSWSHVPVLNDRRQEIKHVCTVLATRLIVCQHLIDLSSNAML